MNSWVICPEPAAQARLRLFCFPYAGGGASVFRSWSSELPSSIEVCAVQFPGRENRLHEPLFERLEPLVQALFEGLQPYLTMPFAFFGHSLGALVGFELARMLVQHNQAGPIHLFVSGHAAPQLPDAEPPIHQLPEAEFRQKLHALNGTPLEILQNAELMELFSPILRADFAINETYVYAPKLLLDCPLSAFGGLEDKLVSRSGLEAWREQTRGVFSVRMLPGDHFFLHGARALLLRAINHDLTQSLGRLNARQRR